jgi:hypothetical protein
LVENDAVSTSARLLSIGSAAVARGDFHRLRSPRNRPKPFRGAAPQILHITWVTWSPGSVGPSLRSRSPGDRALLLALPSVDGGPGAAWLSPRMPRISGIAWAMRFLRDLPVPVLWTGCGFCRPCRHRGADPGAAFHISSTARAAGLSGQGRWLSPVARATGSAQGFVSTFSRGRATASIEPPSERPALAVLLLRVLSFSSGRSRLNDWRRSDRRLQPNSWFSKVAHGVRPQTGHPGP